MLTPIDSRIVRRRIITYDFEWIPPQTVPASLRLTMAGLYDGECYTCFTGDSIIQDFLNHVLTHKNRGAIFYAHSGGMADIQFILESLLKKQLSGEWSFRAAFAGSSAIIVNVIHAGQTWTFVDSLWLMRTSLKHIGETVGLEKGGQDYYCPNFPSCGHARGKCIFHAPLGILRDYNELDCRVLYKAIQEFQLELLSLGGELRKTIASCAMRLFQRRFLSSEIMTHRRLNHVWRQGYIASRVEVFANRCNSGRCYDINSSFPSSMLEPAPGNMVGMNQGKLPTKPGSLYMAEATIKVPDCYLPPLPYRKAGKVFFPVGTWEGMFNNVDLEFLEEMGGSVVKVGQVWEFEPFSDLRDYVLTIYALRKKEKGDTFKKLVYKYLLNSLYGKFSEREDKTEMVINPESTEGLRTLKAGTGIFLRTTERQIPHTHVPIAAHITALSRRLITRYMAQCEPKSLFYCDTDSVFTDSVMETSVELGAMKLEYEYESGRFAAPKLYSIRGIPGKKDRVKAKGFTGLSVDEFDCMVDEVEGNVEFTERHAHTRRRMLRLRELYAKARITPLEVEIEKKFSLKELPKRCKVGMNSRPWSIKEINEKA